MQKRFTKAQSAMEYLMTYGWAILIIAVVLGALFALGIFSGTTSGSSCNAAVGFFCQNPVLLPNGNLTVTIGQNFGPTHYNIGLACVSILSSSSSLPNPVNSLVYIYPNNGVASGVQAWPTNIPTNVPGTNSVLLIPSGQTITISGLRCFGPNGAPIGTAATPAILGSKFTGYLMMNYTLNAAGSPGFQQYEQKVGTISTIVK